MSHACLGGSTSIDLSSIIHPPSVKNYTCWTEGNVWAIMHADFCNLFVFLVNYRGSLGYGQDSVLSLPGNVGSQDVKDVQVSINELDSDYLKLWKLILFDENIQSPPQICSGNNIQYVIVFFSPFPLVCRWKCPEKWWVWPREDCHIWWFPRWFLGLSSHWSVSRVLQGLRGSQPCHQFGLHVRQHWHSRLVRLQLSITLQQVSPLLFNHLYDIRLLVALSM